MPNNESNEFTAIAQRQQEAIATALRTFAEDAQRYAAGALSTDAKIPTAADARAAVEAWFDAAAKALADQRTLATTLVETATEAAEVAATKARDGKLG